MTNPKPVREPEEPDLEPEEEEDEPEEEEGYVPEPVPYGQPMVGPAP